MPEARTDSREKRNARRRALRAANLEDRRAYDREWYARNRDRLAVKRTARTPEQVEREKARKRDYYRRNKDNIPFLLMMVISWIPEGVAICDTPLSSSSTWDFKALTASLYPAVPAALAEGRQGAARISASTPQKFSLTFPFRG